MHCEWVEIHMYITMMIFDRLKVHTSMHVETDVALLGNGMHAAGSDD